MNIFCPECCTDLEDLFAPGDLDEGEEIDCPECGCTLVVNEDLELEVVIDDFGDDEEDDEDDEDEEDEDN